MLERLCGNEYYYFLDGFSGFFQIPIAPEDQEKTTFTCPYKNFAYRRMPFGLCDVPATFQRCMTAIFHDIVEDFMEVFMNDFLVFGNSLDCCLANLDKILSRCEETNLVLNWEKYHFMVKEDIVLGHKISGAGIEVDRAKIDVIAKLPYPTNVKGVRSFLGHVGFYRAENSVVDHLSRLENPDLGAFTEEEIPNEFPDKHLMILKAELNDDEQWLCLDNVLRRCVARNEILEILAHCHSRPTGGHHSASITGRKVYESGFFWPSIFEDAKDYVMRCDACQRSGNISSRSEMLKTIFRTSLENKSTKLVKYQSSRILCVCCSHAVIMEYLAKINKKARILELKRRHLKIIVLTSYTPYPSRKIRLTSLKVLDESFSSNNYVRKFLRALRPKWRAKFTAIEVSNYLSSFSLDELIDNLKVHEMIMEKDFDIVGGKREKRNSLSLKAKKESSDDENSMSGSENEEYSMVVRDFKMFFMRRGRFVRKPRNEKKLFQKYQDDKKEQICFRCKDLNHLIRECPKLPRNKDQRAFVRGSWAILMKQMKKRQTMKRVLWINHLRYISTLLIIVMITRQSTTILYKMGAIKSLLT
ncbi:reverse transcriptase domain-containing protein [Tanacetum coccineum]